MWRGAICVWPWGAVPEVVPALFPELLSMVAADHTVYGLGLKRRALAVLHSCLLTLGVMSGAKQRAVRDLMAPLLPPWLEVFAAALAEPPAAADPARCGFVLEVLRCLSQAGLAQHRNPRHSTTFQTSCL